MVRMKFHWHDRATNTRGDFIVESDSVNRCIEVAEEEVGFGGNIYIADFYIV